MLIACNTFGHLVAGYAQLQQVGDDTSGWDWMDPTCPGQWRFGEDPIHYDWFLVWR